MTDENIFDLEEPIADTEMKRYLESSAKTAKKFENKQISKLDQEVMYGIFNLLASVNLIGELLTKTVRKEIALDNHKLAEKLEEVRVNLNNLTNYTKKGKIKSDVQFESKQIDAESIDLMHMVLGMATEGGEVLTLLRDAFGKGENPSKEDIIDEVGDVLWFMSGVLRSHDLTFEDVAAKNSYKLNLRYGGNYDKNKDTKIK